jgi:hypothetical protein
VKSTSASEKLLAEEKPMRRASARSSHAVIAAIAAIILGCRSEPSHSNKRSPSPSASETGVVKVILETVDETGGVIPARIHLRNAAGEAQRPAGFPSFHDHFASPGRANLDLPAGRYAYEIERGPEFTPASGSLVASSNMAPVRVQLKRIEDMASRGWFSGDLHIHRKFEDIDAIMLAEDLRIAPVATWGNEGVMPTPTSGVTSVERDRFADPTAGEDERFGGALLFFRLDDPLPLPPNARDEKNRITHQAGDVRDEWPPPAAFAEAARKSPLAHIDIEKPFWWDVPTWLSSGIADSIGIAHNHMNRVGPRDHEAWGRPCTRAPRRDPLTNGYCTQDIYYRILESGIRLAPSAGSASGILPNPVGYNRVYVHLDGPLTYDGWWKALKRGHSFVTNGPLLLVTANGALPGEIFTIAPQTRLEIRVDAKVRSHTPIRRVELVRDGRIVRAKSYDPNTGVATFEPQIFAENGWFLVRAITSKTDTFQFASTAPFYVEVKGKPARVSRSAAKFFLTWVEERIQQIADTRSASPELSSILARHRAAQSFWEQRLRSATVD